MSNLNKTVLVTGASSGIGKAITEKLLTFDYHVIAVARNISKLQEIQNVTAIRLDLTDNEALTNHLLNNRSLLNQVDHAVFAAGYGLFASIEEFSYQQIQDLMTVNFISQACITRAVIPILKRKRQGDLIYIGSEAALQGSRKGSVYCASKFAMRGFTQALRDECANSHIRVSMINPGMVATPFFDQLKFSPGADDENAIKAGDIADMVVHIMQANPAIVFDEINLSPLKKVIHFNK